MKKQKLYFTILLFGFAFSTLVYASSSGDQDKVKQILTEHQCMISGKHGLPATLLKPAMVGSHGSISFKVHEGFFGNEYLYVALWGGNGFPAQFALGLSGKEELDDDAILVPMVNPARSEGNLRRFHALAYSESNRFEGAKLTVLSDGNAYELNCW